MCSNALSCGTKAGPRCLQAPVAVFWDGKRKDLLGQMLASVASWMWAPFLIPTHALKMYSSSFCSGHGGQRTEFRNLVRGRFFVWFFWNIPHCIFSCRKRYWLTWMFHLEQNILTLFIMKWSWRQPGTTIKYLETVKNHIPSFEKLDFPALMFTCLSVRSWEDACGNWT